MTPKSVSAYYVAILFTTVLFQLEGLRWLVISIQQWLISGIQSVTTLSITITVYWIVLFLVVAIITALFKFFIIDPLELHANDDQTRDWWVWLFALLVFGLFVYTLNLNFDQSMPLELPKFLVKMFQGSRNTPGAEINSLAESNFYSIFPWIWQVGPVIFMYYYASKEKNKKESSGS